jgi:hypothetical protein
MFVTEVPSRDFSFLFMRCMQKNKSAKVKQEVARIQAQQASAGKNKETLAKEKEKDLRAKIKAEEEKRQKEEVELFKPVVYVTPPFHKYVYHNTTLGNNKKFLLVLTPRQYYASILRQAFVRRAQNANSATI